MWAMDGPRFHRFARRLPAYQGAMRMVAERMAREEQRLRELRGIGDREIVPVLAGSTGGMPADLVEFG